MTKTTGGQPRRPSEVLLSQTGTPLLAAKRSFNTAVGDGRMTAEFGGIVLPAAC